MKNLLAACAAAPLLIACATANADQAELAGHHGDTSAATVLIVNGERIVVHDRAEAFTVIQSAVNEDSDDLHVEFRLDDESDWSDEDIDAFADAISEMASKIADETVAIFISEEGDFDFDFDFDFDYDDTDWEEFGEEMEQLSERIERHAEHVERQAERAAERAERHIEIHRHRIEEHAERAAERAEERAARIELRMAEQEGGFATAMTRMGLRAGLSGIRVGERAIERALERGWTDDDGERRPLTEEEREELRDALEELRTEREELEAELEALRIETR